MYPKVFPVPSPSVLNPQCSTLNDNQWSSKTRTNHSSLFRTESTEPIHNLLDLVYPVYTL